MINSQGYSITFSILKFYIVVYLSTCRTVWTMDVNLNAFPRIGQEMLMEEDYADDEIESELAPIAVQLAYVKQVNKKLRLCKCL